VQSFEPAATRRNVAYNFSMAKLENPVTVVYAAGERGAREAAREGAAVVAVDAFRASTTLAVLVSKGVRVISVASVEEAAAYTRADCRVGERGSIRVRGFDFGNSPTEIEAAELVPVRRWS
jgi:2-phosphosulfolactate phosphatase